MPLKILRQTATRLAWAMFLLAFAACLPSSGMAGTDGVDSSFVDVQLVIAADVSTSMDAEEKFLQAAGFAGAFRDPEIIKAITGGPAGRIAVTYFEWGGARRQRTVVPWMVIDGVTSAWEFAKRIERNKPSTLRRGTSIAAALDHALLLIDGSTLSAGRIVVNLSGDGPDDRALDLDRSRERLLERGATINAMAVIYKSLLDGVVEGGEETMTPADMLGYFRDRVIGGAGAFVEPVWAISDYSDAIRRKLLREIRDATLSAELTEAGDETALIGSIRE